MSSSLSIFFLQDWESSVNGQTENKYAHSKIAGMLPILHRKSPEVSDSGEFTRGCKAALFFFAQTTNVWQTVLILRPCTALVHAYSAVHISTVRQEAAYRAAPTPTTRWYARHEWTVLEPMGASPTLQQQPRNRPFGGVTCSPLTCLHCRGTCRHECFLNLEVAVLFFF